MADNILIGSERPIMRVQKRMLVEPADRRAANKKRLAA